MELRSYLEPWSRRVGFLLREEDKVLSPASVVLSKAEENAIYEPSFRLTPEACQTLMDDLWYCGFRPTEGTGSAGALAATQAHLKDMQRLVFSGKERV